MRLLLFHLHLLLWWARVARLAAVLHLLLLRLVTTRRLSIAVLWVVAHGVSSLVMRLAVVLMLGLMLLLVIVRRHILRMSSLQVDIHAPFIVLGAVLQTQFLTNLLDARLDLLDVIGAVIALADNDVEVRLSRLLRVPDALLEDLFRFLHVLAVQVDRVARDLAHRVVFAEDELGGLFVQRVGFRRVFLALLAHTVRFGAITTVICLSRFRRIVLMLALFFTSEVPESVILCFGR